MALDLPIWDVTMNMANKNNKQKAGFGNFITRLLYGKVNLHMRVRKTKL